MRQAPVLSSTVDPASEALRTNEAAHRELLIQRLRSHIQTVVARYRDVVDSWDVINEAIDGSQQDGLRVTPWLQIIGPEYIDLAFQFAHEAGADEPGHSPQASAVLADRGEPRRDRRDGRDGSHLDLCAGRGGGGGGGPAGGGGGGGGGGRRRAPRQKKQNRTDTPQQKNTQRNKNNPTPTKNKQTFEESFNFLCNYNGISSTLNRIIIEKISSIDIDPFFRERRYP
jgi:hypothetical protein